MTLLLGVNFKKLGKIYHFYSNDYNIDIDNFVIVKTTRGIECGKVVSIKHISPSEQKKSIKHIIRCANQEDLDILNSIKQKEKDAFSICLKKIKHHNLPMKLIDVEFTFDNSKILFYFTSDGRVDFRNLVKDLASIFKNRIELRQIGVRDEAKVIGGISVCGRELCCSTFLTEFQPVSIKMAKEQNLSLNPIKISGACGRLMCCLKYEQESYEQLIANTPKVDAIIKTPEGIGKVLEVNILTGLLKISLNKEPNGTPVIFRRDEVSIISQPKNKNEEIDEELKILE